MRRSEVIVQIIWTNSRETARLSVWTSANVRECNNDVEQEDEGRQSIVKDIVRTSKDFLRRIIVPVEGQGGATLSNVCPHCHRYPLEDHIWWVSSGHGKKQCNWWCAACGGQCNWKSPNRVLAIQDSTSRRVAKVFRARAAPQGVCNNLINALKLSANQPAERW